MHRRRPGGFAPASRVARRTIQFCVVGVTVVVLSMVLWNFNVSDSGTERGPTGEDSSIFAKSRKLLSSSRQHIVGLRNAGKALHGQLGRTKEVGSMIQRIRLHSPSSTSPVAILVLNTSRHAKLPPSETFGTPCRSLPSREVNTIPRYVQCTYGFDDVVSSFVHIYGHWRDCLPQVALATLARMYMPPNDDGTYSTIDVGGNIGACSALLASRGFFVTTFEPVMRNLLALHQTIFTNNMQDRVTLIGAAAGEVSFEKKTITIEVGNHGNAAVIADAKSPSAASFLKSVEKTETEVITTVRIDDLATASSTHVHFAKFDCQGCELGALKGAEASLLRNAAVDVLYVEVDSRLSRAAGHDPLELLQMFHRHAYRLFVAYGNVTRELLSAEFGAFTASCVEDPRDVVAASPAFLQRVPLGTLYDVMSLATDVLALWLTDRNNTDFGSIPKELLTFKSDA